MLALMIMVMLLSTNRHCAATWLRRTRASAAGGS
ncbi:hypothetical protein Gorai_018949 [Gossypium raimondii]|uniref:Uncharacterized protein n=1 Tax=Gossypium raimondii TaxID=29730 RepID=A0A7J8PLS6_GOSRA|nr:hypothetical protein [Gossypium raimondii]